MMTAIASRLAKRDTTLVSILLICLVGFLWAITEIVAQYTATKYLYSLYQVIWVRYATHLLFIILVFGPHYGMKIVKTQRPGLQWLRAFMMLVMPASFIIGANYMWVGNILSIFWLMPLMIIGLSLLFLKERASWSIWLLTIIGLVCSLIISHPNQNITFVGVALSLAMGLSFGLYVVMTRMLREEWTITNLFYTAAGVLVPLSFFLPRFWKPLTLQAGLLMALVGLLGFALLWVLDKALELTSAATLAPFFYSEMFFLVVFRLVTRLL
jgi:drug/metabolite transporter (DMT)-like permease